jgi:hypothetical protein
MRRREDRTVDAGTSPLQDRGLERRRWLARHARTIRRLLEAPPADWSDPRFRRELEDVRRALGPIHSRGSLVASFSREGSLLADPQLPAPSAAGPVPIAYAIRWNELRRLAPPRRMIVHRRPDRLRRAPAYRLLASRRRGSMVGRPAPQGTGGGPGEVEPVADQTFLARIRSMTSTASSAASIASSMPL